MPSLDLAVIREADSDVSLAVYSMVNESIGRIFEPDVWRALGFCEVRMRLRDGAPTLYKLSGSALKTSVTGEDDFWRCCCSVFENRNILGISFECVAFYMSKSYTSLAALRLRLCIDVQFSLPNIQQPKIKSYGRQYFHASGSSCPPTSSSTPSRPFALRNKS